MNSIEDLPYFIKNSKLSNAQIMSNLSRYLLQADPKLKQLGAIYDKSGHDGVADEIQTSLDQRNFVRAKSSAFLFAKITLKIPELRFVGIEKDLRENIQDWEVYKTMFSINQHESLFIKICLPLDDNLISLGSDRDDDCYSRITEVIKANENNQSYLNQIKNHYIISRVDPIEDFKQISNPYQVQQNTLNNGFMTQNPQVNNPQINNLYQQSQIQQVQPIKSYNFKQLNGRNSNFQDENINNEYEKLSKEQLIQLVISLKQEKQGEIGNFNQHKHISNPYNTFGFNYNLPGVNNDPQPSEEDVDEQIPPQTLNLNTQQFPHPLHQNQPFNSNQQKQFPQRNQFNQRKQMNQLNQIPINSLNQSNNMNNMNNIPFNPNININQSETQNQVQPFGMQNQFQSNLNHQNNKNVIFRFR